VPEPTGFLYPFIESEEYDSSGLLSDLAASARTKFTESGALRAATLEQSAEVLQRPGSARANCFEKRGRLFAFGNGGSGTDAEAMVQLCRDPPRGRPLPALSLVDDVAVLTALANDVGYEPVFSRRVIARARAGDIAVGFSTSGSSINMLRTFEEASRRHLRTIGLCGYDGAPMALSDAVQHCLVVRSESVHRIQEARAALMWELWSIVQQRLDKGDMS
jgi:D-sedoheptulose 7-phosphate isomerase